MKEAHFTTETVRSLRYHGAWAYKIPDAPITKEILKITRFTNAKPCDIVCSYEGKFIAVETKQFKKWKALSRHDFRPEQIEGMTNIIKNGKGRAFVFLNIRIKQPYENHLIIFDWKVWGERLSTGSVHAKELKERVSYSSFMIGDEPNQKRIFDLTEWVSLI